ncbi:MAG: hypothetical protein Q9207_001959 [Kuettlingeria erythrocarpa]
MVEMKYLQFKALAAITPIAPAAQALEEFYTAVAVAARDDWASRPRLSGFVYSEGGFSLAMQSWGDTIPWDFVFAMANRLWMCAAQGLPYLFDLAYSSPDGKIAVSITLRLVAEAISSVVGSNGVTPSDGSTPTWAYDLNGLPGNDPDQDYREGSVPSVNTGDPLVVR